jgi:chloramphenicol-sensitive protein RarD
VSGITDNPAASAERATANDHHSRGLLYGVGAYTAWGFAPLYFRELSHVSPWIIVCHRIVWSILLLAVVVSVRGEWKLIWPLVRSRPKLLLLCAGAVLIAANWLIFIYAVTTRQVLQASLGYFINPLLSIALGMIFLGERLRAWQWVAVAIAAAGVANLTLHAGRVPWIAISLAASFALYGRVRKKVNANSLHGLVVESAILFPIALVVIGFDHGSHNSAGTWALLSLSGVVTAVPLLMFGAAVRHLKLSTIGFLQYIGPSLQFVVALIFFREQLEPTKLTAFVLCWVGIGVYVADSVLSRNPPVVADEPD